MTRVDPFTSSPLIAPRSTPRPTTRRSGRSLPRRRLARANRRVVDAPRASRPKDIEEAIARAPWRGGLEPASNVPWTEARVVSGRVPAELAGTVYRAGPGRIRLGANKYAHWFDGDGYVTAIELDPEENAARCSGRYVETARWLAQRASDGGDVRERRVRRDERDRRARSVDAGERCIEESRSVSDESVEHIDY